MNKKKPVLWGVQTQRILDLLEHQGPMTRSEACQILGIDRQSAASIFSRLMRPTKRPEDRPKRIHICGYRNDEEGQRRYPRAIYAIGNKPDARRPTADPKAAKRRYWANRKGRLLNSVFALGLTRAQREQVKNPTMP